MLERAARPLRVLIVEDDLEMRATLVEALTLEGHLVSEASDGIEGLQRAAEDRPDVILLDLMMPRMDGWTFRAEQLRDPGLASIPVVAISAGMADQLRGVEACAHLQKPVGLDQLLETVRHCADQA